MRQFSVLPPGALAACLALQPAPRSLTDPWRAAHIHFGTPPRGVPVQCLCTSQVRVRLKRPVPGLRGRPGADLSDTSRALWREQVRNAQFAGPPAGRIHLWPTGGEDMPWLRSPLPPAARHSWDPFVPPSPLTSTHLYRSLVCRSRPPGLRQPGLQAVREAGWLRRATSRRRRSSPTSTTK